MPPLYFVLLKHMKEQVDLLSCNRQSAWELVFLRL